MLTNPRIEKERIQKGGTVFTPDSTRSAAPAGSASQPFVMYAIRPINDIYHLVTRGGQDTLCGLRVSRISSDRTGNRLQLINQMPVDKSICKHCERIKSQDSDE
jgi:hypothetical protein